MANDAKYSRRYRERHPERRAATQSAYYERNKERVDKWQREYRARPEVVSRFRADHLWRTYGLTLDAFDRLKAVGCPCGNPEWDARPRTALSAVVDHDRQSGKVRGVIHHLCNRSLGVLGDDADGLKRWLAYLRKAG